jgi:copper(I)-binding protein
MMRMNSAAYMVLRNTDGVPDRLLKADSDVAKAVEIQISELKDGVMSIHPVEFIEEPVGGGT